MFKIKAPDGTNNLCGKNLKKLRECHNPPLSQRDLTDRLQINGYDVSVHFVRRIESGQRFVTDIELRMLAETLGASYKDLLGN